MAVTPELYTLSGLAKELGLDRRALEQELALLPPDSKDDNGRPRWLMRTVVPHLYRKPQELETAEIDRRRKFADMERSEMEVALQKRQLVTIDDFAKVVTWLFSEVRTHTQNQLGILPNTLSRHERNQYEEDLRRHQQRLDEKLVHFADRLGGDEAEAEETGSADPPPAKTNTKRVGAGRASSKRRSVSKDRKVAE